MSDKTNTAAALNFLKEMDERHSSTIDSNMNNKCNEAKPENKILFRKSSALKLYMDSVHSNEIPDVEVCRSHNRGGKVIMPEYVVGSGKSRRQRSSTNRKNSHEKEEKPIERANLTLAHILEDGFEDEESDQNNIDD